MKIFLFVWLLQTYKSVAGFDILQIISEDIR